MAQTAATPSTLPNSELLQRRFKACEAILSDPPLLVEYLIDFFGPVGCEPLLTPSTQQEAKRLLMQRCDLWQASSAIATTDSAWGITDPPEHLEHSGTQSHQFMINVVEMMEDPEALLGYLSQMFGPGGPTGLAIEEERLWNRLDDLFLCRIPYPENFNVPDEQKTEQASAEVYPQTLSRGQMVDDLQEPNPMEPEVIPSTHAAQEFAASSGLSTKEVIEICAVCVGVGVLGGLAVAGLGSLLASSAGQAAMGSLATAAFGGLRRPVFTGPRGGRYVITSSGSKSYMVP